MKATTADQATELTRPLRLKRFQDVKDSYVGAIGTPERNNYELELRAEIIAEKIKELRQAQNMTQEELGQKLGVKKAQVSRLESSTSNITLDTLQKVFLALGARIRFDIEVVGE
jgi:HTH-type transcriptional regulator / antitoxin HipB